MADGRVALSVEPHSSADAVESVDVRFEMYPVLFKQDTISPRQAGERGRFWEGEIRLLTGRIGYGSIDYMGSVSDSLRQAIADSGLSQRKIAKDTGICRISLVKWLNGTQMTLTTDAVDKLAEYFGLELQPKTKKDK